MYSLIKNNKIWDQFSSRSRIQQFCFRVEKSFLFNSRLLKHMYKIGQGTWQKAKISSKIRQDVNICFWVIFECYCQNSICREETGH